MIIATCRILNKIFEKYKTKTTLSQVSKPGKTD